MNAMQILFELMSDEEYRDVAQSRWYVRETVTNQSTGATLWSVWAEDVHKGITPLQLKTRTPEPTPAIRWLEYVVALHNEALDRAALDDVVRNG